MSIGSYGPVTFTASEQQVRTFSGLQIQRKARFARHEVINSKPLLEHTGDDLDAVSFSMRFDIALGVNPRTEMAALAAIKEAGEAYPLVIGGTVLADYVITDLSEEWRRIDGRGNVLVASVNVQLLEYVGAIRV